MKEDEVPEKIYLATTEEIQNLDNSFVGIAHSNPEDIVEPVEYVRKDAFVEKACEWFRRIEYDDTIPPYETIEEFIKEFKKAMTL